MRTNIEIDDKLMSQAMALSGKRAKRAVVEEALRLAVQQDRQARAMRQLWGMGWEGNLDEMRASRFPDMDSEADEGTHSKPAARQKSVA